MEDRLREVVSLIDHWLLRLWTTEIKDTSIGILIAVVQLFHKEAMSTISRLNLATSSRKSQRSDRSYFTA